MRKDIGKRLIDKGIAGRNPPYIIRSIFLINSRFRDEIVLKVIQIIIFHNLSRLRILINIYHYTKLYLPVQGKKFIFY